MSLNLNKKSILKKTVQVGGLTFLSRLIAILREVLLINFFGIGALSDAFIVAFRVPNFFRHVFAEGALSASFVPSIVKVVKEGKRDIANGVITLSFIIFQFVIFLMYVLVLFKSEMVISMIAPGFSAEQASHAHVFLKILFPFLFFISGSALLAGALNAVNHFFAPAFGPALLNIVYVMTLALCILLKLPPTAFCTGVTLAGLVHLGLHAYMFKKNGFNFGKVTRDVVVTFKTILSKFFPCLLGVSIVEINLFVSTIIASFLPKGSVSLLYYGSRFMNIPLGVFAVAFASILLPHFSRIVLYAPKRINFYLLETAKFVTWAILPVTIFFMINAYRIFHTMFMMKKGTPEQIFQAQWILIIYCTGLLFFCINKVLLNIFYSLKDTKSATFIAGMGALTNLVGDVIGMFIFGAYGIAAAAAASGIVMTVLCFYLLKRNHQYEFYAIPYVAFLKRYLMNLSLVGLCIAGLYYFASKSPLFYLTDHRLGYWVFVLSLSVVAALLLYFSRRLFGLKIYFIDR